MSRRAAKAEQWTLAVVGVLGLGAAAGVALAVSIAEAQQGRRFVPLFIYLCVDLRQALQADELLRPKPVFMYLKLHSLSGCYRLLSCR